MDKELKEKVYWLAKKLAFKSGKLIIYYSGKKLEIEFKGKIDIVTEADKKIEEFIIKEIKKEFPDSNIIAEESDLKKKKSELEWIIDPIDGTTNFYHGFPFFCVSIAVMYRGNVVLGFVYDPIRDEIFEAVKDEYASLNGKTISVSGIDSLDKALLATGFPYDIRESSDNNINYFNHLLLKAQAIRRAGSAALDLCYVACGRFDGFWEIKLKPWDTAAAALILSEAGGKVTDMENIEKPIIYKEVVGSNRLIHKELVTELNAAK